MMNSLPRSVMLTILCCCCMPCFAIQDINFEWISDRDGLSQNTVRCILQDRKGFLWLGTINGLNRYNGREFIVMNTSMSGSSLVSDYRIRSLSEDKNGYIWARTMANTFICYDPQTERFVDFESETVTYNYSKISILSNHDVWLWGRNGGCSRIRRIEGKLKSKHFSQENFGSPYVYYVYQDSDNCVWICTENGVFFLAENDIPVKFSNDQYLFCYEYDGHLFFVNNDMVTPFNIKNKEYEKPIYYPSGKVRINTTTAMKSGLVLITTRNDTYIFDAKTGKFLPSETVFKGNNPQNATFYTDNKGNTWIYNLTGTMWRQSENAVFEKIRLIPPEILATIDAERFEVWQDSRDIIWITTYGNGLFAIEPSSKITHFTTANSELPTDFLLSIFEDNSGEIWVGSEFSGLIKISLNNYAVKVLNPDEGKSSFSRSNAVRMIFQDSKNRFWIGTRNSFLHIYDSTLTKKQSRKIEGGLPFSMVEDYAGRIWLGTRGSGIKVFDQQSVMNCQNYHLTDHSRYSGSENVFDILIDSKNRIWAATFGGGLHYANIRSSNIAFSQISLNSVNLDQTRVILQDKYGIVWVGTNEGIVAFNPDSIIINNSSFLNFKNAVDNDHSLSNNEVKAIYEDSEGRLWFGTTGGGLNLLMRLIDQLLDFRKLQNKGLELQVQRTDIVGFFSDIFYSFKEIAEKKGIAMRFASKLDSYEMLLDRGKFDKIAYNLMSNAIKYTPENGIIQMKINLSDVEDRMILSVSDSGKGVPKEKQSSLFERFSQFDSTVGGSGVGLHLTSELAAVHRGKVEYIDSELGGACFIVSIPLSDVNYAGYEIIPTTDAKEEVRKNNFATEIPENEDVINIDKSEGNYRPFSKRIFAHSKNEKSRRTA